MLSVTHSKITRTRYTRKLTALAFGCILGFGSSALAADPTSVTSANPSKELIEAAVAQGSMPVENPSALVGFYGYNNDGPMIPAPGELPSATHKVEASKTEPDKNTYLIL